MADVLVNSNVDNIMHSRATHRMGTYWRSIALGHLIIMDDLYDLKFQKTANGGANWTAEAAIRAGTVLMTDTFADLQVKDDAGTLIHIVYLDYATSEIRYVNLDMSDDSVNGDILLEACQGTGTFYSGLFSRHMISITKTRGGNLAHSLNYLDDASTRFGSFRTSIDDGANWVSKATPWEANADYMLLFPANLADNQDLWGLYWDASAQAFSLKTFDNSENSWSEQVFGSGALATSFLPMDGQVKISNGHLFAIWWNAYDSATADLECWEITNAGTITQRTNVLTNSAESAGCSIFIDQVSGHLYVYYFRGSEWNATVKCYYKKSEDNGVTWSDETEYQADAEDDMKWLTAGAMSTDGGRAQAVIFNDDTNDITISVDNDVEIASGVEVVEGSATGSGVGIGLSSSLLNVLAAAASSGIGLATAQAILEVLASSAGSGIGLGTTQALIHVLAAAAASGEGLGEAEALLEVIAEAAGEGIGSGLVPLLIEIIEGTGAGSGAGTASAVALLNVLAEAIGHGVSDGSAPGIIRLILNIKRRPKVHNLGKVKPTPHDLGESLSKYTLGGRN